MPTKKRPKRFLGCAIAGIAGIVVLLAFWLLSNHSDSPQRTADNPAVAAVSNAMSNVWPRLPSTSRPGHKPHFDMFERLAGEDRKLAELVQAALDAEDFDKMARVSADALASTNAELRMHAVEALGWFGARALPELTGAMADADEDIRQTAENHFETALQEIERPEDRFTIAMAAFATLTDEDQLASLGGIVGNAATEFIDGEEDEERQADNRRVVLQALVDVIEGGRNAANVEAAKEAYNDITNNEWLGMDEAERYLEDPGNYDPDERQVSTDEPSGDADEDASSQSLE